MSKDNNFLATKTLSYIWYHPNCQQERFKSILKFISWQFYKRLTDRCLDIKILPSVKIRCYPNSKSSAAVLYCGLYDYDEMNFLLQYLREDDLFIDLGANVGVYTLLAASKIKTGAIYSFEPFPKNYTRLQENIKLNQFKQVQLSAIAISDQLGTVFLNITDSDSLPYLTATANNSTIAVSTDTLDNQLKNQSIANLTLAKMDIEGAELLALKGATSLLKQHRPKVWILEINDTVAYFGHEKQDVVDFLQSYGYKLYSYSAKTNQVSSTSLHQQHSKNVLAIADSAIDFVRDRLR